jgi:MauM/NapG family ferredoxin protein
MVHIRRLSQLIFTALFFHFFFINNDKLGTNLLSPNVAFFFNIDPLAALGTFLSSHKLPAVWIGALGVLVLTLLCGRVFCGFICPFGAINQFFGWIRKKLARTPAPDIYSEKQKIKYLVLVIFLICSVFGVNQTGLLDPFAFLVRSLTAGVIPLLQYVCANAGDLIYRLGNERLSDTAGAALDHIKNNYFYFTLPRFSGGAVITVLFLAVIALNFSRSRWWCRFVCPLGALLGLVARYSPVRLKVNEKCTHCMSCVRHCEGACNPHKKDGWIAHECVMCFNCIGECREQAVSFKFAFINTKVEPKLDIDRRRVLTAGVAGLLAAPVLRQQFFAKRVAPSLIRPPGALPEPKFLEKCIKCGNCIRACPTNFLNPALLEAGFEGLWTPMGIGMKGYCDYECTLCGQACPTGAIERLPLPRKKRTKIGTACVDRSRCLTYAFATSCAVCEEHCPTPQKAIWLDRAEVVTREGKKIVVEQPHVDPSLCIGCSNCENVCPVVDKPAIYVTAIGETRSRENKLILGY